MENNYAIMLVKIIIYSWAHEVFVSLMDKFYLSRTSYWKERLPQFYNLDNMKNSLPKFSKIP